MERSDHVYTVKDLRAARKELASLEAAVEAYAKRVKVMIALLRP